MKKRSLTTIMFCAAVACASLTSCVTSAYASGQYYDDVYTTTVSVGGGISYSTIVTYGTPYYYNGLISYYLYNGWCYYPYLWNDIWYFRPFHTPRPDGFMYLPGGHHHPDVRLGDMRRQFHPNFGDRHYEGAHISGGMQPGMRLGQQGMRMQSAPQTRGGMPQMHGNTFDKSSSRMGTPLGGSTRSGSMQTPRMSMPSRSSGGMQMGGSRGGSVGGPAGRMGGGRR